jgi:hypothetical protein
MLWIGYRWLYPPDLLLEDCSGWSAVMPKGCLPVTVMELRVVPTEWRDYPLEKVSVVRTQA